jgi:ribosomal protein L21E
VYICMYMYVYTYVYMYRYTSSSCRFCFIYMYLWEDLSCYTDWSMRGVILESRIWVKILKTKKKQQQLPPGCTEFNSGDRVCYIVWNCMNKQRNHKIYSPRVSMVRSVYGKTCHVCIHTYIYIYIYMWEVFPYVGTPPI